MLKRRVFLTWLGPAALVPFGAIATGCGKAFTCSDGAGLSAQDRETRTKFAYTDRSSDITRLCDKCTHFTPGEKCGGCKVLPGPIHPQGTCTLFSPR